MADALGDFASGENFISQALPIVPPDSQTLSPPPGKPPIQLESGPVPPAPLNLSAAVSLIGNLEGSTGSVSSPAGNIFINVTDIQNRNQSQPPPNEEQVPILNAMSRVLGVPQSESSSLPADSLIRISATEGYASPSVVAQVVASSSVPVAASFLQNIVEQAPELGLKSIGQLKEDAPNVFEAIANFLNPSSSSEPSSPSALPAIFQTIEQTPVTEGYASPSVVAQVVASSSVAVAASFLQNIVEQAPELGLKSIGQLKEDAPNVFEAIANFLNPSSSSEPSSPSALPAIFQTIEQTPVTEGYASPSVVAQVVASSSVPVAASFLETIVEQEPGLGLESIGQLKEDAPNVFQAIANFLNPSSSSEPSSPSALPAIFQTIEQTPVTEGYASPSVVAQVVASSSVPVAASFLETIVEQEPGLGLESIGQLKEDAPNVFQAIANFLNPSSSSEPSSPSALPAIFQTIEQTPVTEGYASPSVVAQVVASSSVPVAASFLETIVEQEPGLGLESVGQLKEDAPNVFQAIANFLNPSSSSEPSSPSVLGAIFQTIEQTPVTEGYASPSVVAQVARRLPAEVAVPFLETIVARVPNVVMQEEITKTISTISYPSNENNIQNNVPRPQSAEERDETNFLLPNALFGDNVTDTATISLKPAGPTKRHRTNRLSSTGESALPASSQRRTSDPLNLNRTERPAEVTSRNATGTTPSEQLSGAAGASFFSRQIAANIQSGVVRIFKGSSFVEPVDPTGEEGTAGDGSRGSGSGGSENDESGQGNNQGDSN